MENVKNNETVEFMWRRLLDECPVWAILVPVAFAFFVVGLIVLFRPRHKLKAAVIGGTVVGVIALAYLPLAFILQPLRSTQYSFSWLLILLPVLAVALFYVVLMYLRDSRSVHVLWAIFLGLLRTSVYACLALVFLLPSCQYYDKQEYESKVLFLFDVSGSMATRDDLAFRRQDKVVDFWSRDKDDKGKTFVDRVQGKSSLVAYRFGSILDEDQFHRLNKLIPDDVNLNKPTESIAWDKWLNPDKDNVAKPNLDAVKDDEEQKKLLDQYLKRVDMVEALRSGTNIGGACLQAYKLQGNSYLQAIVVVSDGQSNTGSSESAADFIARVSGSKQKVPVFTVGVGQFRQPKSIRIDDLEAPQDARPDDRFPIRVPVSGIGLREEEFTVTLEVSRVKDNTGKEVEKRTFLLPLAKDGKLEVKKAKFKGGGDFPAGKVEFEIDLQELMKISAKDDKRAQELEGEWHFTARVPRNDKETAFVENEHVSETVKVQVQKRALRVLLFAGGATREYQFLRTILYREMQENRMDLVICLQSGKEDHIDQDVGPERMLADFPNKLGPSEPGPKYMSLNDYDCIVAFDPDWSKLSPQQLGLLKEWVGTHAGGIIFVAGPVFTWQVARPGGRDISSLLSIFPLVLKDNRLHGLGLTGTGIGHDSSRPYALNFPKEASQIPDFMKLDEEGTSPTAGWNGFFWNDEKIKNVPAKAQPKRGFYTYYPVEKLKPDSAVIASFAGPEKARINNGKDDPPFIVSMRYGAGKSLYLGSGELWRLRSYNPGYHERLWIKMARYVAAGATQQKKYGRFLMSRVASVGTINCEVQVKGKDLLPLPSKFPPTVRVERVGKNLDPGAKKEQFELRPKPSDGEFEGYFTGSFVVKEPGEYEFQLPIPDTNETLRHTLIVRKPNPELDNLRTNFGYLYQLASEADPLLNRLSAQTRREIEPLLVTPQDQPPGSTKRLFFPLGSADAIEKCLVSVPPKTETVKGRYEDLWDRGFESTVGIRAYWVAILAPLVIGLFGALILFIMRQWLVAGLFFGVCVLMSVAFAVFSYFFSSMMESVMPLDFSYVLMIVVGLLGIEWLSRKLLRLA